MATTSSASESSPTGHKSSDLEAVHTPDKVHGHKEYYEKDGLRTYGDDEDHDHEPPVGDPRKLHERQAWANMMLRCPSSASCHWLPWLSFGLALRFPSTSSVMEHMVQADLSEVLANLLALAAICPFVGSLSDLMGRRYVAIVGSCFVILGMIISSTATNMNNFIGKSSSS
ncbi:MAG: hypothetical protein Q9183_004027 [Haloplaca sp. 2 TL-2023]